MSKRIFVPVESYCLASPEMKLEGKNTDIGLLAEALVLFDKCDVSVTNGNNLADILESFVKSYGSISPFIDLVASGALRIHFFDFWAAPIEKNGQLMYWNVQDDVAAKSHQQSFEQKVLYDETVNLILPKARQRQGFYTAIRNNAVIDAADDYGAAIDAAREAAKSHEEMELLLNAFRDSLPVEHRGKLPERISVTAIHDKIAQLTKHQFNFDFEQLSRELPSLNFGVHIPGVGLLQTYRVLYASRKHGYDVYLPYPLAESVLAKMDSLVDGGKRFSKTAVDLTKKACFPDIRSSFNQGLINWKDVLEIRKKAARFRAWFAAYGGDPNIALTTYGEEFRASSGLQSYREKFFSITSYVGVVAGAAIGAFVQGPFGATAGAALAGAIPFTKDLFKASDEEGWKPRFFGDWIREKQRTGNSG